MRNKATGMKNQTPGRAQPGEQGEESRGPGGEARARAPEQDPEGREEHVPGRRRRPNRSTRARRPGASTVSRTRAPRSQRLSISPAVASQTIQPLSATIAPERIETTAGASCSGKSAGDFADQPRHEDEVGRVGVEEAAAEARCGRRRRSRSAPSSAQSECSEIDQPTRSICARIASSEEGADQEPPRRALGGGFGGWRILEERLVETAPHGSDCHWSQPRIAQEDIRHRYLG